MNLCDECETASFCYRNGCIPITDEGGIMNNQTDINRASAMPLIERLRSIPKISILRMEQPKESSTWGIGAMCHEAADALAAKPVPFTEEGLAKAVSEWFPDRSYQSTYFAAAMFGHPKQGKE